MIIRLLKKSWIEDGSDDDGGDDEEDDEACEGGLMPVMTISMTVMMRSQMMMVIVADCLSPLPIYFIESSIEGSLVSRPQNRGWSTFYLLTAQPLFMSADPALKDAGSHQEMLAASSTLQ